MPESRNVRLGVIRAPYIAYFIVGGWTPIWLLYEILINHRDDLIYALLLGVGIFGGLFLSFWLYRVQLLDGVLIEKGFLRRTKRVPVASLRRWQYELGWPDQKWLWRPTLRPFRRLSIYYEEGGRERPFDVSLNLFGAAQVRELIEAIRNLRPDWDMPKSS